MQLGGYDDLSHVRYALMEGAEFDPSVTSFAVYEYYQGICGICGSRAPLKQGSMDHITPLSQGGSHTWSNVQYAHRSCSSRKGAMYQQPVYVPDGSHMNILQEQRLHVAEKILHTLSVYPGISPTMLQAGMGPQFKPAVWRPILEDLRHKGYILTVFHPAYNVRATKYIHYQKLFLVTDVPEHYQEKGMVQ